MLTCLVRRRVVKPRAFVSGILTCAHILSVLGMGLLVVMTVCRRSRMRTIHVACLSGSSLELTDGAWRKRIVCGVVMGGLSVDQRIVSVVVLLVMRRSKGWWRVDVNDRGMIPRRRGVGVAMLLVMAIVLSSGVVMVVVLKRRVIVVCGD